MDAQRFDSKRFNVSGVQESVPAAPQPGAGGVGARGSLLVDVNGVVRFCSHSVMQLVGCSATDVVGKSINSLLPGLPIREGTPGYNVAVTTMLFGDSWLSLLLPLADGSARPVQASVAHLDVDGGRMFSVELQWLPPRRPGPAA